jgi:hypothetical protein
VTRFFPGWDGRDTTAVDLDPATDQHLRNLSAIVGEARNAYDQERYPQN